MVTNLSSGRVAVVTLGTLCLSLFLSGCGGGGGSVANTSSSNASSSSSSNQPAINGPSLSIDASGLTRAVPVQIVSTDTKAQAGYLDTPVTQQVSTNTKMTLATPDIFGDRQFSKWVFNGQDFSASTQVSVTPSGGRDVLTAVYTPRPVGKDGFLPNYAQDTDPSNGQPMHLFHWANFPVRVYFIDNGNMTAERKSQCLVGFDYWVKATNRFMIYQIVNDQGSADITLQFVAEGRNGRGGVTDYQTDGSRLTHAAITLNLTYLEDPNFLPPIAAHEFGHALGIGGHSDDGNDIMSPYSSIYALTAPSARDLNTLITAYSDSYGRSVVADFASYSGTIACRVAR